MVNAEILEYTVCFTENGAYHVVFDNTINTEVSYDKIKQEGLSAISEGHLSYPSGITESDKVKYQFTSTKISGSCYVENNTVKYCPSSSQLSKYDVINKYMINRDANVIMTLDANTGKFTIKLKDLYNDEIYVRYVRSGQRENAGDEEVSNFSGQFLSLNNGYYTITNVSGGSEVRFEFYIKKSGTCSGSYLGNVSLYVPPADYYEIDNPALNNEYYGCNAVYSYVPNGVSSEFVSNYLTPMKKNYITECYNPKISYSEKNGLRATITSKLNEIKNMFANNVTNINNTSNSVCTGGTGGRSNIYSDIGRYWRMTCTAEYSSSGDTPKLVTAGQGVEYNTSYSATRTCTIERLSNSIITMAPRCFTTAYPSCSWPETSRTGVAGSCEGEGCDAGPNENFDECIYSCDQGSYTQECINSCYNDVYGNNRDLSFTDTFSYKNNKTSNIKRTSAGIRIETFTSPNTNISCNTGLNNPGHLLIYGNNQNLCFSNICAETEGAGCIITYTTQPMECEDNPEEAYNTRIEAAKNEYRYYLDLAEKVMSAGTYNYKITDSYLTTDNGNRYVYNVSSNTNPGLIVNTSSSINKSNPQSTTLGIRNDGAEDSMNYTKTITSSLDVSVSLPNSYVDKTDGNVVYQKNGDNQKAFNINHRQSRFQTVNFNQLDYYNGGTKYYTSIWSPNINVTVTDTSVALKRNVDNIYVSVSGLGTSSGFNFSGFSTNNVCYYGVYNNFYQPDDGTTPNPDGNNNLPPGCNDNYCGLDGRGIQYIYRPIVLGDVFPNDRNPRWNWTNSAKRTNDPYLKYNIDPIAVTNHIQSMGESIYDVDTDNSEIDYEFLLTRENIANIRAYNHSVQDYNRDGYYNYADYNMSCYTNSSGRKICTSRFMDNINGNSGTESSANFITYSVSGFTIDARKNLAGCNNSKSGSCFNIGG